jgi:phosphopantothenoylcysteine decarboxylase/phosphopantothenate--cysteine ligase
VRTFEQKVKKTEVEPMLRLERTPDILAMLGERKQGRFLVGFAAETHDMERYAREKLRSKNLDAIIANDVSRQGGVFGMVDNELAVLWGSSSRAFLGPAGKRELARSAWGVLIEIRKNPSRV